MGELEIRGPWVAAAYHGGTGSDKFTDDGWFRTGDVVRINERGCMRICDRAKDLVKSGGEWISSVDLENQLMAHTAVAEAAVIAVPDEKWGERPLAAVVLRDGMQASPEELREHLGSEFAKWQLPDRIEFIDDDPADRDRQVQEDRVARAVRRGGRGGVAPSARRGPRRCPTSAEPGLTASSGLRRTRRQQHRVSRRPARARTPPRRESDTPRG